LGSPFAFWGEYLIGVLFCGEKFRILLMCCVDGLWCLGGFGVLLCNEEVLGWIVVCMLHELGFRDVIKWFVSCLVCEF